MQIKFFNKKIEKFIEAQEINLAAKILRTLALLEKFGNDLGMPHSKKIDRDLFELRVRGKVEIRIFYTFHNGLAVLLHIFIKKTQELPSSELSIAFKRLKSLEHESHMRYN